MQHSRLLLYRYIEEGFTIYSTQGKYSHQTHYRETDELINTEKSAGMFLKKHERFVKA
jgi:hypothetical protein